MKRLRKTLKWMFAAMLAFTIGYLTTLPRAHAQEPQRFDMKVRNDFFAGFGGDKEALERGMKFCADDIALDGHEGMALVPRSSPRGRPTASARV